MGASSSRAGGGRGNGGGRRVLGAGVLHHLQKEHRHLRSSESPRRVAPADHSSGTQNLLLNPDSIQGVNQGQLLFSPTVQPATSEEQMASVRDGRNLNEEINVACQVSQAMNELHIASDSANKPKPGMCCGFEALDVHDKSKGIDSILPIIEEEEDDCPICLEGFDEENPNLATQCGHHYHLSCILEWMERAATCPICGQVAIFDESH